MSDPTLPLFCYSLERQPPRTDCGAVVRGASVREFPAGKGIAELDYVVSGSCRTTLLRPDGAETDTLGPADVWYFPSGWGHSIRGIGAISF
jgi:oxalate decarboxylase